MCLYWYHFVSIYKGNLILLQFVYIFELSPPFYTYIFKNITIQFIFTNKSTHYIWVKSQGMLKIILVMTKPQTKNFLQSLGLTASILFIYFQSSFFSLWLYASGNFLKHICISISWSQVTWPSHHKKKFGWGLGWPEHGITEPEGQGVRNDLPEVHKILGEWLDSVGI